MSKKLKKLELEEDECVCSMRCNEFCGPGGGLNIPPGVGSRQDTTPPGVPVTPPLTTIPEKGVEPEIVCDMRFTGDPGNRKRTPIGWKVEKSPSIVYGRHERFGDVKEMVGL